MTLNCKYGELRTIYFFNPATNSTEPYQCPFLKSKKDLCIFHDKDYALKNPDIIRREWHRADYNRGKDERMFFIGCYFNDILFNGTFVSNVDFSNCNFSNVDFSNCNFSNVDFSNCNFSNVDFSN